MDGYLTTAQTLKFLGISRSKLKRLVREGFLTVCKIGQSGAWFFKVGEVIAVMRPVGGANGRTR